MKSKIDEVLSRPVAEGGLTGVLGAVGNRDGSLYEGAFGNRRADGSEAMTPDTVICIASMTKAVTGAAAMQLVERGELRLDDPAAEVSPELGRVRVLEGFDSVGQPILRPPASQITLRQLLTHTSGYGYDVWSEALCKYQEATDTPSIFTCENAALSSPLLFDPGTAWVYGMGIDWAGKLVEAISGQTLGAYFQEHILGPLGMTSTAFEITPDMRGRLASIYARTETDGFEVLPFEMPQDPEFQMGGGGLYSTVTDYLRFTRAMLNRGVLDGQRILRAETVEEMSRNNMGELDVTTMKTVLPHYSNDANFYPGMQQKWGLSFLINTEEAKEGRSANSLAWAGLANSYFWIDPHKDVCGVWATQLFPFADEVAMQNFRDFEAGVYDSL